MMLPMWRTGAGPRASHPLARRVQCLHSRGGLPQSRQRGRPRGATRSMRVWRAAPWPARGAQAPRSVQRASVRWVWAASGVAHARRGARSSGAILHNGDETSRTSLRAVPPVAARLGGARCLTVSSMARPPTGTTVIVGATREPPLSTCVCECALTFAAQGCRGLRLVPALVGLAASTRALPAEEGQDPDAWLRKLECVAQSSLCL